MIDIWIKFSVVYPDSLGERTKRDYEMNVTQDMGMPSHIDISLANMKSFIVADNVPRRFVTNSIFDMANQKIIIELEPLRCSDLDEASQIFKELSYLPWKKV